MDPDLRGLWLQGLQGLGFQGFWFRGLGGSGFRVVFFGLWGLGLGAFLGYGV